MSAVCGALSVAALHWTACRFGFSRWGALLAAMLWGVLGTVWSQSVTTEVYSAAMLALIIVLGLLSPIVPAGRRTDARPLAAALLLLGVGSGLHQMLMFALPALAVSAWFRFRHLKLTAGIAVVCVAAALLGLSVQIYLPLRAAAGAAYAWEQPDTWDALWGLITTRTFHGQRGVRSVEALAGQLMNYGRIMINEFGAIAVLLCAWGAAALWRMKRRSQLLVLGLLWGTDVLLGLLLFNIPDDWLFFVNVFFLPSFIACCLLFGGVWDLLSQWRTWSVAVGSSVVLIVLLTHQPANDRSRCYLLRDWVTGVLNTVPQDGIVVLQRDEAFPVAYAQLIERQREDVAAVHWMVGRDPDSWAGRKLRKFHPDLRLPLIPGWQGTGGGELAAFVAGLDRLNQRSVLLTSFDPDLAALSIIPWGLLYMVKEAPTPSDIKDGLDWWTLYPLRDVMANQSHHEPADEELARAYADAWHQAQFAAAAAGLGEPPRRAAVSAALGAGN